MALIVIGVGAGLLAAGFFWHDRDNHLKPPPGALTSKAAPSSVKPQPQAVNSYTVPATDPKFISIAAIAISKTRIVRLGLTKDSQIAVPDNIYDTGWYDASAKPGQAGAMFVYGHVSSWQANGIFYDLKKLKPGDDIVITRGDNTTYTYKVAYTKVYPYNNVPMSTVLAPADSSKPGLNLMTCTGAVIKGTSEFAERLVVFTSLASK